VLDRIGEKWENESSQTKGDSDMRIILHDPDGYGKKSRRVCKADKLERRQQRRAKRQRREFMGAIA